METFRDFHQKLIDLIDTRVRLCIRIHETERVYEYYGWIRKVKDHTLTFEADPTVGNTSIKVSHFNLEAVVIYGVDEVDEDADLSVKDEGKHADIESVIEVRIGEDASLVKGYTDMGWEVGNYFSGKVQLVKRKQKETETKK